MKTTRFGGRYAIDAPKWGAVKVWWLIDNVWIHKGWLMPPIGGTE